MFKNIILIFYLISISQYASAQGCVAIRSNGQVCTAGMMGHSDEDGKGMKMQHWQLNVNVRYFESFRHYRGKHYEKEREANKTEVINHQVSTDITLTRMLSPRWALAANLPIISNTRTSLYEHGGRSRHGTKSFGLGDLRIAGYYWLANPVEMPKGNLQAGLGIKLPTGDYAVQDFFFVNDSTRRLGPVDQSIQLGDGGTGFTLELNGYYNLNRKWSLYGNFFYLLNPREHNGVSTARGATPNANAIRFGSSVMSVPDQYMYRAGINYAHNDLNVAVGYRMDCIPSSDLVGGSAGFRRPGYVKAIEPTVTCRLGKTYVYAAVPVAIARNRTQSYSDKQRSTPANTVTGDAAFADYAINVGCFFRF